MTDGLFTFGTLETVEVPAGGPEYANDSAAKAPLGVLYRHNGKVYRYVLHSPGTAVATIAGGVAYWKALDPSAGTFTVSSDQTDSIADINGVAGFYGNHLDSSGSYVAVTSGYYTWIQVGGTLTAVLKDGSASVGAKCFGNATDEVLDYVSASATTTGNVIAIVIGGINITSHKATILLQNLIW